MLNINLKKINLSKKTIGYIAYTVGITVFFLYYLFPSEAVKGYIAYNLQAVDPQMTVDIARVKPSFPPGLKLTTVRLARSGRVSRSAR